MSVKTERTCDNASCGRYIKGAHSNYYHVALLKSIYLVPDDNGPWDFCSAYCLSDWAASR